MLWKALRQLELQDTHFRRQVPVGPYIADFLCHRARLIVEVDGGVHDLPEVAARDAERLRVVSGWGYRVLRFSDRAVIEDVEAVLGTIAAELSVGIRPAAQAG